MSKLKLGFDIDGDYSWNNQMYRSLIKDMLNNSDQIDLYLITKNTDITYVASIQTELDMDITKVFQVADDNAVEALLSSLNINIYLSTDAVLIRQINLNIPFIDNDGIITGCEAILVSSLPDSYKAQPKYITILQFWIGQFNKTQTSEESC